MARSLITLFLLLAISFGLIEALRQQAVSVHGHLKCGDAPAKSVRVKLFDEDSDNGEFNLQGSTMEATNIDPVFKVYHDCNDGMKPGSRKVRFIIPSSYITNGPKAKKTFELGTLNLETIFGAESRELIVSKKRRHLLSEKFNLFSNF